MCVLTAQVIVWIDTYMAHFEDADDLIYQLIICRMTHFDKQGSLTQGNTGRCRTNIY